MERLKELLTLAPFIALAIAIAYLQGYWGAFDVLAFPYLSFQELLTYSTAPFFGFMFFAGSGMLIGVLNGLANRNQLETKRRKITSLLADLAAICIGAWSIYIDSPDKWLLIPLLIFGLSLPLIFKAPTIQSLHKNHALFLISFLVALFFLFGSFGYGRSKAERLIKKNDPDVQIILESGTETGKLIGKLGSYYFFLDTSSHVNVLPEHSVKRISHLKKMN